MNFPKYVEEYAKKKGWPFPPETQEQMDAYLDLINHAKEYAEALEIENAIGVKMTKKLGFKTSEQIIKEGLTQPKEK